MDFAPGDLVVCVDADEIICRGGWLHQGAHVRKGVIYRVSRISPKAACSCSLVHFNGEGGGIVQRFRKIDKADEQFTEQVRACRPIKHRVPA